MTVRTEAVPHITRTVALDERYSQIILGINDENLKVLENQLDCQIHVRGTDVTLIGVAHEVARALKVLQELQAIARRGHVISPDSVKNAIHIVTGETPQSASKLCDGAKRYGQKPWGSKTMLTPSTPTPLCSG